MEAAGDMINQILQHLNPQILFDFIRGYDNVVFLMVVGYTLHFIPRQIELSFQKTITDLPLALKAVWMVAIILLVIQTQSAEIQPFIYFQF
jgi:hypothetical protein